MTKISALVLAALLCAEATAVAQRPLVLQVQTLDGQMKWLSDFKGKVVLLNFWSTTCPPCRTETPWFVEFQQRWEKDGFTVVGVSMDDAPEAIRQFNAKYKVNYPMMVGREAEDAIQTSTGGIWAMPTSFLIGRDGAVITKHIGLVSKAALEQEITEALRRNGV